ncbi:hypothetical protein AVEN_85425-1 [Araneus ventricosus]|uniref:Uncharacterized protein n=1 Tax=Araneus ventricosus TaxID=182803 RepID=A0A4Y2B555_ARAVE|nr:hypothetical protein AVEN_85425-1 [Araneus ventricosus]
MTTAVRDVEMVGHVHWFQYENGIRFPAEIGVSEDRPVNRVASRNISRLPFGYEGLHTKEEAERKIIRFVEDKLLAVKGHDQKVYFESLGLTVVELESVLPCCPKYSDLPEEVFHPKTSPRFRRSIHYKHDDSKCSRIIAIAFAKFVEMKRREESDKYWDDQAKSSESSDWSKYWGEQAESSEWDDEPADKSSPESSSDEPADKPESSDWGNYWDEQESKEQPAAAADEQARKEPASKEPKQPIAADEPVSSILEPKQSIVWEEDIIEKDVLILNLQHLKNSVDSVTVERGHLKIIIHL